MNQKYFDKKVGVVHHVLSEVWPHYDKDHCEEMILIKVTSPYDK